MTDHKFDRETDRQALLSDQKARIIDLTENRFSLPETGIYDEPVRYFKANLKWTPIIFGFLDWLEDVAGWKEAEDDNYPGIQSILIFEEGIEPLVTTQAELKAAICEGLTCWSEEMSKRILSGKGLSFSVDDEGNIVVGGADGDSNLPEDDPATEIDERLSAKAGGAIGLRYYLNGLFEDLMTLYGDGGATQTPLAQAQAIIGSKYNPGDPDGMEAATAEYYANTETTLQQIASLGTTDLDAWIFCKGLSIPDIIQYIWDETTFIYPLKLNAVNFMKAFQNDAFVNVSIDNEGVPSTAYLDYPCVPIPDETITLLAWDTEILSVGLWKPYHRMLVKVSGVQTDPDGDIQDPFWYVSNAGVRTFNPSVFIVRTGIQMAQPTALQVPYSSSHIYEYTVDVPGGANAAVFVRMARFGSINAATPFTPVTVEFKDLGQYRD